MVKINANEMRSPNRDEVLNWIRNKTLSMKGENGVWEYHPDDPDAGPIQRDEDLVLGIIQEETLRGKSLCLLSSNLQFREGDFMVIIGELINSPEINEVLFCDVDIAKIDFEVFSRENQIEGNPLLKTLMQESEIEEFGDRFIMGITLRIPDWFS